MVFFAIIPHMPFSWLPDVRYLFPFNSFTALSFGSIYLSQCWQFTANHWPTNIWKLPLLEDNKTAQSSGPDRETLLVEHEKAKETTVYLLEFETLSVVIVCES